MTQVDTEDGRKSDSHKETTDVTCDFSNRFLCRNIHTPEFACRMRGQNAVQGREFTVEDVYKKLDALKPDTSSGCDKISPALLNECARQIIKPLYLICYKSLNEGGSQMSGHF